MGLDYQEFLKSKAHSSNEYGFDPIYVPDFLFDYQKYVNAMVSPENAPIVVGAVGGLAEIENRILTPAIRSIVRNVTGSEIQLPDPDDPGGVITRPTSVLDLIVLSQPRGKSRENYQRKHRQLHQPRPLTGSLFLALGVR